ncbi:MAG TPA: hypothetical protein VJU17_02450 [Gemmatimonadales bacterium]|nr:hypothetical protein [Gemmatimonadales bacterium]
MRSGRGNHHQCSLRHQRRGEAGDPGLGAGLHGVVLFSRTYYDVVLVTTKGKQIAAGHWIRNKREADWLAPP